MAQPGNRKGGRRRSSGEQAVIVGVLLTLIFLVYNGRFPSIFSSRTSTPYENLSATALRKLQSEDAALIAPEEPESDGGSEAASDAEEEPYYMEPRVKDWDEQRRAYIAARPGCNATRDGKPKVMLVSGSNSKRCGEGPNSGDFLLLKFLKNKQDYARVNDMPFYYGMGAIDPRLKTFWVKLPMLRMLMLQHPDVELFLWVDSDAMITDMAFRYPIEKQANKVLVMSGLDADVYGKKDWVALNTGSFLIRNSQEGLDLLDDWGQYGRSEKVTVKWGEIASRVLQKRKNWPADDQTALVLMLTGEGEKEEDRAKGLKPLADRWAPRTHLDPTYTLHGFWGIFVDKLEAIAAKYHNGMGNWEWPFTVHFTGCKLCDRKFSDYDPDTCDRGIHRSYAFADNQVLKRYSSDEEEEERREGRGKEEKRREKAKGGESDRHASKHVDRRRSEKQRSVSDDDDDDDEEEERERGKRRGDCEGGRSGRDSRSGVGGRRRRGSESASASDSESEGERKKGRRRGGEEGSEGRGEKGGGRRARVRRSGSDSSEDEAKERRRSRHRDQAEEEEADERRVGKAAREERPRGIESRTKARGTAAATSPAAAARGATTKPLRAKPAQPAQPAKPPLDAASLAAEAARAAAGFGPSATASSAAPPPLPHPPALPPSFPPPPPASAPPILPPPPPPTHYPFSAPPPPPLGGPPVRATPHASGNGAAAEGRVIADVDRSASGGRVLADVDPEMLDAMEATQKALEAKEGEKKKVRGRRRREQEGGEEDEGEEEKRSVGGGEREVRGGGTRSGAVRGWERGGGSGAIVTRDGSALEARKGEMKNVWGGWEKGEGRGGRKKIRERGRGEGRGGKWREVEGGPGRVERRGEEDEVRNFETMGFIDEFNPHPRPTTPLPLLLAPFPPLPFALQAAPPSFELSGKRAKDDFLQPSFELSGKLAEETNRFRGVALVYNEPPEARKPSIRWRLYVFKDGEPFKEPLYIHRQTCYLFGRERKVADVPTDHPSCSKQHAVVQFRLVDKEEPSGEMTSLVRPYLMDLGSTNGTFLNGSRIDAQRYYELMEKDTVKFGNSSREYVLLHEHSAG
ncbi:unnamed protein product [Closterium sp. Naga37s-1]|nr:unnamed protein product [Closterium sp. Naga37s-1]